MPPGGKGSGASKDWAQDAIDDDDEYEQAFAGFFGGFPASVSTLL